MNKAVKRMRQIGVVIVVLAMVASPLLGQLPAHAETYMGIGCDYTINDVKAMFPGASFEEQKVAWVKPGERFIYITGAGIVGTIAIFFEDWRPAYREVYKSGCISYFRTVSKRRNLGSGERFKLESEIGETAEKLATEFAATQSDDKGYRAKWVRWIPNRPIPFSRLKAKFGEAFKYKIDNSDFSNYAMWDSKNISAQLSDDKKYATQVDFGYTPAEQRKGMELSVKRLFDGKLDPIWVLVSVSNPPTGPGAGLTDGEGTPLNDESAEGQ